MHDSIAVTLNANTEVRNASNIFDVYTLIVQATNLERNSLAAQNFETAFANFMTGTQNFMVTQNFSETASR